jgi:hypothetical protein
MVVSKMATSKTALVFGFLVFVGWRSYAQPTVLEGVLMVKVRTTNTPMDRSEEAIRSVKQILETAQIEQFSVTRASRLSSVYLDRYVKVEFPPHRIKEIRQHLASGEKVERVEPIPIYFPFFNPPFGPPNDLNPDVAEHLTLINVPEAWQYHIGRPEVTVAVIDNGFDVFHEDMIENCRRNTLEIPKNGLDDDNNGYVDDYRGFDAADGDGDVLPPVDSMRPYFVHGTACASVAAATTHNGKGMAGAGFRCSYLPVKAAPDTIAFAALTHSYQAVEYAIAARADVISMSFGSSVYSSYFEDLLLTAHELGIVCVAAAGNAGAQSMQYPCGYSTVLCVTSVDDAGRKTPGANFGPWVDVCASGVAISASFGNDYKIRGGTSMACAAVAGVCALLKSYRPEARPDDIRRALIESARNLDELNADYVQMLGGGLVDAAAAMRRLRPIHCEPVLCSPLTDPVYILKLGNHYPSGTGPRNIVEKAQFFEKSPGFDYVSHIELRPGYLSLTSLNDSASVALYSATASGRPGPPIHSTRFSLKDLKNLWERNENLVIALPQPVRANGVFAALRLPHDEHDTLALVVSDNSTGEEKAWERAHDGSWTTIAQNWRVSIHLGIELRFVSQEAVFDPGKVRVFGNENVFHLLYDNPEPDATLWMHNGKVVGESKSVFLTGLEPGEHTYKLYVRRGMCIHELQGTLSVALTETGTQTFTEPLVPYPNPNDGTFRIRGMPQEAKIEVLSLDGRLLKVVERAKEETEIRIPAPGIYAVKVTTNASAHAYLKVVVKQ